MDKKEKTVQETIGTIQVSKEVRDAIASRHENEAKQGLLKSVLLPMDNLGKQQLEVIVRVPSRDTVTNYMRFIDAQPKKAQELLINYCLLTSKDEVNEDDNLFFTAVGAIAELFPIRQAIIKNF
ncbi:MAG: hypothetical protein PHQ74_14940 [Crocinitomicaceae bacterium]|nr:hypothetical protein [Crocinitomicaceae bacterium]